LVDAASAATVAPPDTSFASQGSVLDLSSPANVKSSEDTVASFWTTARNPLVAMEAMAQEDGEDSNGESSNALVKSAVTHCLKRNTSLRDLLFTPQQLKDMLKSLIVNQSELLEFAVRADSHQPSLAVPLAPQLREAIPDKFVKKLKYKEVMADRLAACGYLVYMARDYLLPPSVSFSSPCAHKAWDCTRGLHLIPHACPHLLQGRA
jgi:hypothetical protein